MKELRVAVTDRSVGWWGTHEIVPCKEVIPCSDNTEETGCLSITADRMAMFCFKRDHPVDLTVLGENGAVSIYIYIDHASDIAGAGQLEISSSGQSDLKESCWNLYGFKFNDGWNKIVLPFSNCDSIAGGADFSAINYTRIYLPVKRRSTMKIADQQFITVPPEVILNRVTYAACGGVGTQPPYINVEDGTELTLSECTFVREGFEFKGWYEFSEPDKTYMPGDKYTVRSSATFCAKWEEVGFTVPDFEDFRTFSLELPMNEGCAYLTAESDSLRLSYEKGELELIVGAQIFSNDKKITYTPCGISGDIMSEDGLAILSVAPDGDSEVISYFTWSSKEKVLRKRLRYRFSCDTEVDEIRMDRFEGAAALLENDLIDLDRQKNKVNYNSFPAFMGPFFAGIEYPVASTRQEDDGSVIIGHSPFSVKKAGIWHQSRTEIIGLSGEKSAEKAFEDYFLPRTLAYGTKSFHFNYNCWYSPSLGYPFDEEMILNFADSVFGGLKPCGEMFDSFAIDNGWSDPEAVWEVNRKNFKDGLAPLVEKCEAAGSKLGVWFSPSAAYPDALSPGWAVKRGYSVTNRAWLCLHDPKYASELIFNIPSIVKEYGVKHVKADAMFLSCTGEGHGHRNKYDSIEQSADTVVLLFNEIRRANPDIWIETTCLGYNPSPWWLEYAQTAVGAFGDDTPHGRVPAPDYRISGTSGRDFYNIQGSQRFYAPVITQDEMGVVHQTPSDFTDDMIVNIMRGNAFVPMYIDPENMDKKRWQRMGDIMKWARANEETILSSAKTLVTDKWQITGNTYEENNDAKMCRTPYGYAHGRLIMLRNPWIEKQEFEITVPDIKGAARIVSLYPKVRLYADGVKEGDKISIPLCGYETLVLEITNDFDTPCKPLERDPLIEGETTDLIILSDKGGKTDIRFEASVSLKKNAQLLVLLEAQGPTGTPAADIYCDGEKLDCTVTGSAQGWAATFKPVPEHWVFVIADIPQGTHNIKANVTSEVKPISVSAHIRMTEAPQKSSYPNAIPAPELVAGDSFTLFSDDLTSSSELEGGEETNGSVISLCDIKPSATLSALGVFSDGSTQNNEPIRLWNGEKAVKYNSGISLHAFDDSTVAFVEYDISDINASAIEVIAGVDYYPVIVGNQPGSCEFRIVFDGRIAVNSGILLATVPHVLLKADIPQGTKTLRLEATNAGDGFAGDWADFADPKLFIQKNM